MHVRLPSSALLGDHKKPADFRANFMSCIHRVSVGSLAVALVVIPSLSVSAYITAKYSLQRTVAVGPESASGPPTRAPIWSFRTQQIPILRAFAQVEVMKAFASEAIDTYSNPESPLDPRVRAGIACCAKAFLVQQSEGSLHVLALSERCGAQGLFHHNQIISVQVCAPFPHLAITTSLKSLSLSSQCEAGSSLKVTQWHFAYVCRTSI